jgi:hypothetical protein
MSTHTHTHTHTSAATTTTSSTAFCSDAVPDIRGRIERQTGLDVVELDVVGVGECGHLRHIAARMYDMCVRTHIHQYDEHCQGGGE